MGTVMLSGQGHASLGFTAAGAHEYINAATVGRLANDPLNSMRTPVLYTASSTAYNPHDHNGNPVNRWGDYSYTCLDPNDDMTMWTIQEFCNSESSYGVRVAQLLAPPPATITNSTPATVVQDSTNVDLALAATSVNGSGF